MDLAQVTWLIEAGNQALAENVLESSREMPRRFSGWQVELLREQVALRRRAAQRFPYAERWLWTERSLAQASDWWCASYKASRFPSGVTVVDGCCGAGVDLVALAGRGAAVGIDRDPVLVALANANLAAHGLTTSAAKVGDLPSDLQSDLAGDRASEQLWLHLDPDRRVTDSVERRLRKAEDYSPSLQESLEMARRCEGAMIKLAPASVIDPAVEKAFRSEVGLRRCWLGNLGECRQQLLLTGKLAAIDQTAGAETDADHAAVLCEPHAQPLFIAGRQSDTEAGCETPKRFIYDCHAVLHAAQLQLTWAESVGAEALGTSQGYFTSDNESHSAWAQVFEVIEVLPWDQRRVKRWLREHKIGEVEVKKRLLQLDANESQRQLRGAGSDKITLMITRLGDRVRAVVAKRIDQEPKAERTHGA